MFLKGDEVLIILNGCSKYYDFYVGTGGIIIDNFYPDWQVRMFNGDILVWKEFEMAPLSELGKAIYE